MQRLFGWFLINLCLLKLRADEVCRSNVYNLELTSTFISIFLYSFFPYMRDAYTCIVFVLLIFEGMLLISKDYFIALRDATWYSTETLFTSCYTQKSFLLKLSWFYIVYQSVVE